MSLSTSRPANRNCLQAPLWSWLTVAICVAVGGAAVLQSEANTKDVEPHSPPPRHLPEELRSRFTLGGLIPVADYYVDDSNGGRGTHYKFSADNIEEMIQEGKRLRARARVNKWLQFRDRWIFQALERFSLEGKRVAVFGSMSPWYEAVCLVFGASKVVSIEYNQLSYEHDRMETMTVEEFKKAKDQLWFDAVLSISSFDHDGLGRYGDPVDPDGDLKAMKTVAEVLAPEGIFLLTVPVGPDYVVWNLHRRYGAIRLEKLLAGWTVVERFGWDEKRLHAQESYTKSYEPVHVLRRMDSSFEKEDL